MRAPSIGRRALLGGPLAALVSGCAGGVGVAPAAAEPALAWRPLWDDRPMAEADWPGGHAADGLGEWSADGQRVFNIGQPSVAVVRPAPGRANGTAMVVAPGGGFRYLAIQVEGVAIARWLAARGVTAFVLRYRTFHEAAGELNDVTRDRVMQALREGWGGRAAAADGLQALRWVRRRAAEWGVDPRRVGAIGFSAGGHVAGMAALAAEPAARADFAALIYGTPLGVTALPPANLPDPPGTPTEPWRRPPPTPAPGALPPLFLAMAQDDRLVSSGVRGFYDLLYAAGYRPELHLFRRGGHGFGLAPQGRSSDSWSVVLASWLSDLGLA